MLELKLTVKAYLQELEFYKFDEITNEVSSIENYSSSVKSFFFSCDKEESFHEIEATKLKTLIAFSDSIFFGQIKDIHLYGDKYYFADKASRKIIVSDTNFIFQSRFGKVGDGPKEYRNVSNFHIYNDTVYMSGGDGKMAMFTTSGHSLGSHPYKLLGNYEFYISRDGLYSFDYFSSQEPLGLFKRNHGELIYNFGSLTDPAFNKPRQHISGNDSILVAVYAVNTPEIHIYDHNGNLKGFTDLRQFSLFKQTIENSDKSSKLSIQGSGNIKVFTLLIQDIWLDGNLLYLLSISSPEDEVVKCNTILKYGINQDFSVSLISKIQLDPNGWYNSIAVLDNGTKILASENLNGAIELFKID